VLKRVRCVDGILGGPLALIARLVSFCGAGVVWADAPCITLVSDIPRSDIAEEFPRWLIIGSAQILGCAAFRSLRPPFSFNDLFE